ncbi:hypothetical protein JKJ11_15650 [Vibrio sp. SCSIO 43133]|uniref:hypothetical protein n=1 Tax=Vibrio sp. SCSIO 43133 TaxID=2802577 RepID=UPI00218A5BAC|nr:hypothetical protein JKJ11_15650 [Vibrio sp. SCSIO 43133]
MLEFVWIHLRSHLLKASALNAGKTPVRVLGSDKSKAYMWLYCSGADSPEPENAGNIVLCDHQMCRSG